MPCVYLPGPAPAVTVANNYTIFNAKKFIPINLPANTLYPLTGTGF